METVTKPNGTPGAGAPDQQPDGRKLADFELVNVHPACLLPPLEGVPAGPPEAGMYLRSVPSEPPSPVISPVSVGLCSIASSYELTGWSERMSQPPICQKIQCLYQ